ncbi:hypothetical protein Nepgr_012216 [Nepenthes gracilis]|uniref:stizolobate synthase n=1 Tax=Nepenthes gracilis TaxID=150966 RepID=A0AAD3SGJ2_NEPGR|nr:hypothetical protein Nepgr_012216 [Nepenthes gracilis]
MNDRIKYPAPGALDLATRVRELLMASGFDTVHEDRKWGLDHGAWVPANPIFFRQAEKRAELTEENAKEISADKLLENDQHSSKEAEQEVHKEQPDIEVENNEGAQLSLADNSQPDEAQPPCLENNMLENTKQPSADQLHHLTVALLLLGNPTSVKRNPKSLIQTLSREMEVHNKDELSIQANRDGAHHYGMGRALAPLKEEGVLIIGSGSATHNVKTVRFDDQTVASWASEFDQWLEEALSSCRYQDVIDYEEKAPNAKMAHPMPEHFYPLLVALGAIGDNAKAKLIHRSWGYATMSYASYKFTAPPI